MKGKRFIAIILVAVLVFGSVSVLSFAQKPEVYSGFKGEDMYFEALEDEVYIPQKIDSGIFIPNRFYSNPDSSWLYYNFLTEAQKFIYDCIIDNEAGLYKGADSSTVADINVRVPDYLICGTSSTYSNALKEAMIGGISAAIDDYPEYFWLGGYGVSYYYSNDSNGKYWVTDLTIRISIDTKSYDNFADIRSCYNTLMNAVADVKVLPGSRYTKLKSIHDYICSITTYDLNAKRAHQPTGVFMDGKAVCEGYAETLKLLCDREGIPCILVVGLGNGGAHKWNYVKMEDNKWYGVDVTWDDQSSIYYDFFLSGSETTNVFFGGEKFGNGSATDANADHVNVGTHFGDGSFALTYPVLSTYSYTGVAPFFNATAEYDNERGIVFLMKDSILSRQLICTYSGYTSYAPSNNSASISGNTTGATLNISSPISKTYKVVRRGDVNADNSVSRSDIDLVKAYLAGDAAAINTINSSVEKFNAADLNQDGVIDGFDLYYVNSYVNTNRLLNK